MDEKDNDKMYEIATRISPYPLFRARERGLLTREEARFYAKQCVWWLFDREMTDEELERIK